MEKAAEEEFRAYVAARGSALFRTARPPDATATDFAEASPWLPDWPAFVRLAIAKLPPRTDYTMQSGYDVYAPGGAVTPNAYAVINLGANREHGHLTLNLDARGDLRGGPTTCAALSAPSTPTVAPTMITAPTEVLFCTDGTPSTPMVFGLRTDGRVAVTARYADHRTVWMESNAVGYGVAPEIDAEALRAVVTDPALVALLPVA